MQMLERAFAAAVFLGCFSIHSTSHAQFAIEFDETDFVAIMPTFSDVQNFNFSIDVAAAFNAGTNFTDPTLNGVVYQVFGGLDAANVPSGFSQFNLQRTIGGLIGLSRRRRH